MADRPYTLLSCCVSLDGYLDSSAVARLALSNDADFDRVDAERAGCDAILVGANTIRRDDPRLLVKSAVRRAERVARGVPASPARVTLTRSGGLAADAQFFVSGDSARLVYCPDSAEAELHGRIGDRATVIGCGPEVDLERLTEDLSARGVGRLMVEGGGTVNTAFLMAGLVDQLDLVVAPLFVGDPLARRFVGEGAFPWTVQRRATLAEVQPIGDVVLLRYALSSRYGRS
jgi:5-amino-6-(5-phosphoribosylamino)uracil reductase